MIRDDRRYCQTFRPQAISVRFTPCLALPYIVLGFLPGQKCVIRAGIMATLMLQFQPPVRAALLVILSFQLICYPHCPLLTHGTCLQGFQVRLYFNVPNHLVFNTIFEMDPMGFPLPPLTIGIGTKPISILYLKCHRQVSARIVPTSSYHCLGLCEIWVGCLRKGCYTQIRSFT